MRGVYRVVLEYHQSVESSRPPATERTEDADTAGWHSIGAALLVCAAVLLVYLPTPGDYWILYDNEVLIRHEPRVQALALEGDARSAALVEMFTTPHGDLYQPLLSLSLAIDYALFGWNRAGYHAHSTILHLAVVCALFVLAWRLSGSISASLLAALLAAVHPTQVEAVSWVIHRTLLVTALLVVLASHVYLGHARDPTRPLLLVASNALYIVAMMAKAVPTIFLVPLVLDLWVGRRVSWRMAAEKLPLFAATLSLALLNLRFSHARLEDESLLVPWWDVLMEAPAAIALSTANTVWPQALGLFYPIGHGFELVGLRWLAIGCAGVVVLVFGLRQWQRGRRGLLLGVAGWLALLAPAAVSTTYRDTVTADRYGYLPMLLLAPGLAAGMAGALERARPPRMRTALMATGAALVILLGVQARVQARKWSDEERLWNDALQSVRHPIAFAGLGNVYRSQRRWIEASASYERAVGAVEHEPDAARPFLYYNLAEFALEAARGSEQADERARHYELARRAASDGQGRWPEIPDLSYDLGRALLAQERYVEAAAAFESALALRPADGRAMARLAVARSALGERESARELLERSLLLTRRDAVALSTLAALYEESGEVERAAELLIAWGELEPSASAPHARQIAATSSLVERGEPAMAEQILDSYVEHFPRVCHRELLAQIELSRVASGDTLVQVCAASGSATAE